MKTQRHKVVLDTHVFLKGLSGFGQVVEENVGEEDNHVKVCRHVRNVCHTVALNDDILDEYLLIARRRTLSLVILQDKLADLKKLGKMERTGKLAGKRPIISGPKQDRPFIEVAISVGAKYIVTEDPDFRAFEKLAEKHHFRIATSREYLAREGIHDPQVLG